MTIQTNFPAAKPSLLLDFANNKRLDPRITFTRTTTATYYDGVTTAKAEENLLSYSQEFNDVYWNKTNTTITTNNQTAPDGTTTAETITAIAGTSIDAFVARFNILSTANLSYTLSFFAKAGTYSAFQITNINFQASSAHANFDLSAGTVGTSGNCTASIVNAGAGWYRCIVVFTATATVTNGAVYACLAASTSATRFQKWSPVGTETIHLWGAQLEQRSQVTAYTPTTTQAITNYIPVLLTAGSGVSRFDHNPVTRESLGLLVEEARTNLLTYSSQFDNAAWAQNGTSTTANNVVAPDGAVTGDKLVENTVNTTHFVSRNVTGLTDNTLYTFSVYLKAAERTWAVVTLLTKANSNKGIYVNLSNGAVGTSLPTGGAPTSSQVTSVGNGWYRVSVTVDVGAGATTPNPRIFIAQSDGVPTYTGNGYSGIYIWGAQLEVGANPTSYIPTVASTATRNAETCSIQNISPFFNVSEGTLYFKVSAIPQTGSTAVQYPAIGFTPAALNSSRTIQVFKSSNSNTWYYLVRIADPPLGNQVALVYPDAASATAAFAIAYKTNDFGISLNGATAQSQNTGILPLGNELTALCIGSFNGTGRINGTISKIAYYRKRLTNAQLQALTT